MKLEDAEALLKSLRQTLASKKSCIAGTVMTS